MSAQEGFSKTSPHLRSLIDQIDLLPQKIYTKWLMLWSATILAISAALVLFLPDSICRQPNISAFILLSLSVFCGLNSSIYYVSRFFFSKDSRFLLFSISLFILALTASVQPLSTLVLHKTIDKGWYMTIGWMIFTMLLFCIKKISIKKYYENITPKIKIHFAGNKDKTNAQTGFQAVLIGAAFLLLLCSDPVAIVGISSHSRNFISLASQDVLKFVSLIATVAILIDGYRKSKLRKKRSAFVVSIFTVECAASIGLSIISGSNVYHTLTASSLMLSFAWITLLAGIVIDAAMTHNDLHEQVDEMEALRNISNNLVGISNIRKLLDTLADTIVKNLDVKIASVYLSDSKGECLELAATAGMDSYKREIGTKYEISSQNRRPGFHTGHTVSAYRSKEITFAHDLEVDAEFVPWRIIAEDDGCAISIPLINKEENIGVLNLYFAEHNKLTHRNFKLIMTLAAAATLAIEKTHFSSDNYNCGGGEYKLAA